MTITEFPPEIQKFIFSFLDIQSLNRASQVCNKWKQLIRNDNTIWKSLFERSYLYSPQTATTIAYRELLSCRYRLFKNLELFPCQELSLNRAPHHPIVVTSHFVFVQKNNTIFCTDRITHETIIYSPGELPTLETLRVFPCTKDIIQLQTDTNGINVTQRVFEGELLLYDVSDKNSNLPLFSTKRAYIGQRPSIANNSSWQPSNIVLYLSDDKYLSAFNPYTKKSTILDNVKIDLTLTISTLYIIEGYNKLVLCDLKNDQLQVIDLITGNRICLFKCSEIGLKKIPLYNEPGIITKNSMLILSQEAYLIVINLNTTLHQMIPLPTMTTLFESLFNENFLVLTSKQQILIWDLHTLDNRELSINIKEFDCRSLFIYEDRLLSNTQTSLKIWNLKKQELEHEISIPKHDLSSAKIKGCFEYIVWLDVQHSGNSHSFLFVDILNGNLLATHTYSGEILEDTYGDTFDNQGYSFQTFTPQGSFHSFHPLADKFEIKIREFAPHSSRQVEVAAPARPTFSFIQSVAFGIFGHWNRT